MLNLLLHLSLACFVSLPEARVCGFSTSPSFNFFGFGCFVTLAIIEISEVNVSENTGHTTNEQTQKH